MLLIPKYNIFTKYKREIAYRRYFSDVSVMQEKRLELS